MACCPICGKEALSRPQNPFGPFCSMRCKQVDLGKWLDGGYRVPTDEAPDAATGNDESASSPSSSNEEK